MKRVLMVLVAVLAIALCSSAFAQYNYQKKTPEQRMQRMTTMLDLTPEQQTKVKDIIMRRDAEMGPLFKSLSEAHDKEEQREIKLEILEQHQRFRKELNDVLTDEQEKKYQEFIQKRMQERKMRNKS